MQSRSLIWDHLICNIKWFFPILISNETRTNPAYLQNIDIEPAIRHELMNLICANMEKLALRIRTMELHVPL